MNFRDGGGDMREVGVREGKWGKQSNYNLKK